MKEAIHFIDGELIRLPSTTSPEEIHNFKKLAEKGMYKCPYCEAELFIKSGEHREIHFSHRHSEACEPSKMVDKAEKKYSKQVARETVVHKMMVDIIYDELKTQARTRADLFVDFGYRAKPSLTKYPDIWAKIGELEVGISVVTNVKPSSDNKLSKEIENRHKYFMDNGLRSLWFIERKEWSIEKEKHAIVLWDAESVIASYTPEDRRWEAILRPIATDDSFFQRFNYPTSMFTVNIDVRSMYYIYSTEERIVIKVQRFIRDRDMKPFRAFLLNDGYEIPFAQALYNFQLGDKEVEEQERLNFLQKYDVLELALLEKKRTGENKKIFERESREIERERERAKRRENAVAESLIERKKLVGYNQQKWGYCQICGEYTNDWWMFDGATNTCKCNQCKY